MSHASETAGGNALRTAAILFVFALIGTAILAFTHDRTEPVIAASHADEQRALLAQVLPASVPHDNDLLASRSELPPNKLLGTRHPSALWRAEHAGHTTALLLEAIAPQGYAGEIALLVGVARDGRVTGVRVTAHRETPGLGDYIDRKHSDWIEQFAGRGLTAPDTKQWLVKKDGGAFDARAGATITPRAVVKAVRDTLTYVDAHPELWKEPAE